jgi:general secretion pathway protein L
MSEAARLRRAGGSAARAAGWRTEIETRLRDAIRWWLGELAALVPAPLRRRLAGLRGRLLLLIDMPGENLILDSGGRRRALGRIDFGSSQAAPGRRILAALPRGTRHGTAVTVRLPARHALRTTVSLPLAAERNLDAVVGFEFERLVPFKRDDVYYAYRIEGRDKAAISLRVELTVVPRAALQEVTRALERHGLRMTSIEVVGAAASVPLTEIAIGGGARPVIQRRTRIAMAVLGAVAAMLAIAAVAIPLIRAQNAIAALTIQVADAKRLADADLKLQQQIDAESQGQDFLLARKRALPSVTQILDALTRLAPDDTYLTELQINSTQVRLIGVTASATALLALIDQSPSFRNAAFQSSITQDPKLNRERFDISATIAARGKP